MGIFNKTGYWLMVLILICSFFQISYGDDLRTWLQRLPGGRLYLYSTSAIYLGKDTTYGISSSTGFYVTGNLGVKNNLSITGLSTLQNADYTGYNGLYSRTAVQLRGITPTAVGQMYWNSNAVKIFVSTGTDLGSFAASDNYTQGP